MSKKTLQNKGNYSGFSGRIFFQTLVIALILGVLAFFIVNWLDRSAEPIKDAEGNLKCPPNYEYIVKKQQCLPLKDYCKEVYGKLSIWQDFESPSRACTCIKGYHIDISVQSCVPGDPPVIKITPENAAEYGFEIVPKE